MSRGVWGACCLTEAEQSRCLPAPTQVIKLETKPRQQGSRTAGKPHTPHSRLPRSHIWRFLGPKKKLWRPPPRLCTPRSTGGQTEVAQGRGPEKAWMYPICRARGPEVLPQ